MDGYTLLHRDALRYPTVYSMNEILHIPGPAPLSVNGMIPAHLKDQAFRNMVLTFSTAVARAASFPDDPALPPMSPFRLGTAV